jgi:catechol 2,3-dioxygenase-like lactoylglutathione lyase family enzyme
VPGSEDETRIFYGQILGLEEIPKPANLARRGGIWFRCGALELHVGIEADFRPSRKAHPAFLVVDLDDVRERLRTHEFETWEDEPLSGYRRFYASDPFGNRLEFLEPASDVREVTR